MNYLSSDQAKKYILLNFSLFDLFCLFDLSNFQKAQLINMLTQIIRKFCDFESTSISLHGYPYRDRKKLPF